MVALRQSPYPVQMELAAELTAAVTRPPSTPAEAYGPQRPNFGLFWHDQDTRQLAMWFPEELFIDNFAGGGGASTGIRLALGRPVDIALNHNWAALAMHRQNEPQTLHFREDIRRANWAKIVGNHRVGGVWWSPDCTHHSRARGGKPKKKEIRGLAWTIVHFVNVLRSRVVSGNARVMYLENVLGFLTWCPLNPDGSPNRELEGWYFRCLTGALYRRGFRDIEWTGPDGYIWRRTAAGIERTARRWSNRACDHGAPTIRQRLYMIMRSDGRPIVWPEETHADPEAESVKAAQRQPHRATAEFLDFSLVCPSIFLTKAEAKQYRCKRPLVEASLKRIAKGVGRHVINAAAPFILELTHQGNDGVASVRGPIKTITSANRGEKALVTASVACPPAGEVAAMHITKFHGDSAGVPVTSAAPTITGNSYIKRPGCAAPLGLVQTTLAPFVTYAQHGGASRPANVPAHTLAASPKDQNQLVAVFLAQQNGGKVGHQSYGHPVKEPLSTISGKGCQQQVVFTSLVKYYGTDQDPQLGGPAHTITTVDRFALVETHGVLPPLTPELEAKARRVAQFLRDHGVEVRGEFATVGPFVIVDIGMRMLTPRELYRLQGFPEDFVIDRGLHVDDSGRLVPVQLTRTQQIHMCGNSVCPEMARTLVAANNAEMRNPYALAA